MRHDKAFSIAIDVDGQPTKHITPRKTDAGFVLRVRMRTVDGVIEHSHVLKIYGEVAPNGIVRIGVVTPLAGFERDAVGNLVKDGYRGIDRVLPLRDLAQSERGKIGGSVSSLAKAKAARKNGKKGGRPRRADGKEGGE